jgi:DNA-binding response OmpR family regulator
MAKGMRADKPIAVWVEDDPDFQAVVREWLLPRYDLMTYNDGESLLDELKGLEPDIFILDVRLPGIDGFKLCRKIRRDQRLASIPILFLTSCKEDVDFIKHLDVGGTAYLNKPAERKELLSRLEELLPE